MSELVIKKNLFSNLPIFFIIYAMLSPVFCQEWVDYKPISSVMNIFNDGDYLWVSTLNNIQKINKNNGLKETIIDGESRAVIIDNKNNKWCYPVTGFGLYKIEGSNRSLVDIKPGVIRAIALDKNNNMWIGTLWNGIFKYDGSDWTVYNKSNSMIPCDTINSIIIDKNENIWIATEGGGLVRFNENTWKVYNKFNSKLPSNFIKKLTLDSSGALWIGTDSGLLSFSNSEFTLFDMFNSGLPYNFINDIAIDKKGNIWIVNYGSALSQFDGINWKNFTPLNSSLPNFNISTLTCDREEVIWIGFTNGELIKFDEGKSSFLISKEFELPDSYILSITTDRLGNKWFGTDKAGLVKLNGANWKTYNTDNSGLKNNYVPMLVADRKNNIWVVLDDELIRFDGANWSYFNSSNSLLSGKSVKSIAADSLGNIWVGMEDGYLNKYDGVSWTGYKMISKGISVIVYNSFDRKIWFGSQDLIYNFNGIDQKTLTTISQSYKSLAVDKMGNIWICRILDKAGAILKYDGKTWISYDMGKTEIGYIKWITDMAVQDDKVVWMISDQGCIRFDGKLKRFYHGGGIQSHLAIDQSGNKWIAASTGLQVFNEGGVVSVVKEKEVLPVNDILYQNYPNPFNPSTSISYNLHDASHVRLDLYDSIGRQVKVLINEYQYPGNHSFILDGSKLCTGVYYYRLVTEKYSMSKKLVLLK